MAIITVLGQSAQMDTQIVSDNPQTFSLLISNILLASLPSASTYISTASMITCGMSVVSGVTLCARHDSLEKTTGCNAAVSLTPSLFDLVLSSLALSGAICT